MTQEEKQLLLIDICARLPYQPMCEFTDTEDDFCKATAALGYSLRDFISGKIIIKPYLRPMSSMTEDEKKELLTVIDSETKDIIDQLKTGNCGIKEGKYHFNTFKELDWVNAHHFDYRGLITMGLSIEAPEGMYNENC